MNRMTKRALVGLALTASILLFVAPSAQSASTATAVMHDASGERAGVVVLRAKGQRLTVTARMALPTGAAGFHGFHIHTVGVCDPATGFASAGGHLGSVEGHVHDDHAGDMPSLLVQEDGRATLAFETDRAMLDQIFDGDGAAVIVHQGADNFANIPERYAPNGPDATTLNTGDAGARLLCGELR
ncbi:MAG TPA: superoxide dismutase family protein [Acidimicrobiales bacterium]|jgi:superoxide dismutase, Cu-Zn family|nr:superoxide dismutase family protein [Acidimicrobiales bacterium]